MKTLVVYYSLEGHTRAIAGFIAKETGADLLELKPVKQIPTRGIWKFFHGGAQAILKKTPELLPFDIDARDYDLIFVGTPVWAGLIASPMRTFLTRQKVRGKRIALFCTCMAGRGKSLQIMKELLEGNYILGEMEFRSTPDEMENWERKAMEWVRSIAVDYEPT
jgi:Flavodoxins